MKDWFSIRGANFNYFTVTSWVFGFNCLSQTEQGIQKWFLRENLSPFHYLFIQNHPLKFVVLIHCIKWTSYKLWRIFPKDVQILLNDRIIIMWKSKRDIAVQFKKLTSVVGNCNWNSRLVDRHLWCLIPFSSNNPNDKTSSCRWSRTFFSKLFDNASK